MGWNFQNDRPIYTQLVEQIELRIVSGVYPPGSRLPSVRDMAAEAAVNPNTMQRALAALETDGLLYTHRTSGRFITEDEGKIMQIKDNLAEKLIHDFFTHMEKLGYTREQAIALLKQTNTEEDS